MPRVVGWWWVGGGLGVVFRHLGGGVVGGWYHTPKLGEGGPNSVQGFGVWGLGFRV